jgi:RimJ/RimL family protein N-acetyltransferase
MDTTLPEQIETKRLIIRVAKPGDGTMFNRAVVESQERLAPWLPWVTPCPTVEESELDCRRAHARFLLNEDLLALLLLRETGALVGASGLHKADWKRRRFEVGYWGHSAYAGRGLITEAVRALTEHALAHLGATRVVLKTDDRNTRSWQLAERTGFQLEGILLNEQADFSGCLRSTRIYSRVPA